MNILVKSKDADNISTFFKIIFQNLLVNIYRPIILNMYSLPLDILKLMGYESFCPNNRNQAINKSLL